MAGETVLTVVGTLTSDPDFRFLPNGAAVCNFTIASNARTMDRNTNQWKDEPPLFLRCSVWRDLAEHCAESLTKGTRVIAQGYLKMRPYETREGEKRTSTELDVQAIGPELRFATAKVQKAERGGPQGGGGQGYGAQQPQTSQQGYGQQTPTQGVDDPWSQSAGAYSDTAPF
ncbi:single-stranded DNA-binding protein [Frankia sp. AgW1.1]|uniref:single-stranded DNA-binding protein n=1 Tax=Frankia sp. AgW1.1 TaxID=1836971 RepID=UPI0019330E59|nr:single-stranded DNA-binding protein [Frankia sp. AgW1.1]MBL7487025.1 single-stranded DNA-binding protein [Frankia sp. AgW1.1]